MISRNVAVRLHDHVPFLRALIILNTIVPISLSRLTGHEWADLRQERSTEMEAPAIPDSDYADVGLRLRNMTNVS